MPLSVMQVQAADLSPATIYTLPFPDTYSVRYVYHTVHHKAASGYLTVDTSTRPVSTKIRAYQLSWKALTATQYAIVKNVFALLEDNNCTFVTPDNAEVTVSATQEGETLNWAEYSAPDGDSYYDMSLTFADVST